MNIATELFNMTHECGKYKGDGSIMKYSQHLAAKQKKIGSDYIGVFNKDKELVGLVYVNKHARQDGFKLENLNGRIPWEANAPIQKKADSRNLVCSDISPMWAHNELLLCGTQNDIGCKTKRSSFSGTPKGLDVAQIRDAAKTHGGFYSHNDRKEITIFKVEDLGMFLYETFTDMSEGEKKVILMNSASHSMAMSIKKKEKPSRYALHFFDPNATNRITRVDLQNAEDLKHLSAQQLLLNKTNLLEAYGMMDGSLMHSVDFSSKEPGLKVMLKNTGDQLINVKPESICQDSIIKFLFSSHGDAQQTLSAVTMDRKSDYLSVLLGFAKDNTKMQEDIINSLCGLDGCGWTGLAILASNAPGQLATVLCFECINDILKELIISALCKRNSHGVSGLSIVARNAPLQLSVLHGFADGYENSAEIKKNIVHDYFNKYSGGYNGLTNLFLYFPEELELLIKSADITEHKDKIINPLYYLLSTCSKSMKKRIVSCLGALDGSGCLGLGIVARCGPEDLKVVLGVSRDKKLMSKIITSLCCVLGLGESTSEMKENIINALCDRNEHGNYGLETIAQYAPDQLRVVYDSASSEDLGEKVIASLCDVLRIKSVDYKIKESIITAFFESDSDDLTFLTDIVNYAQGQLGLVLDSGLDEKLKKKVIFSLCGVLGTGACNSKIKENIIDALCARNEHGDSELNTIAQYAPDKLRVVYDSACREELRGKVIASLCAVLPIERVGDQAKESIITTFFKSDNDGLMFLEGVVDNSPKQLLELLASDLNVGLKKKVIDSLSGVLSLDACNDTKKECIINALCAENQIGHSCLKAVAQHAPEQLRVIYDSCCSDELKKKVIASLCDMLSIENVDGKTKESIIAAFFESDSDYLTFLTDAIRCAPGKLVMVLDFGFDEELNKKVIDSLCGDLGIGSCNSEIKEKIIDALCARHKHGNSGLKTIAQCAPDQLRVVYDSASREELRGKVIASLCSVLLIESVGNQAKESIITTFFKSDNDGLMFLADVIQYAPRQLVEVLASCFDVELKKKLITCLFGVLSLDACSDTIKEGIIKRLCEEDGRSYSFLRGVVCYAPRQLKVVLDAAYDGCLDNEVSTNLFHMLCTSECADEIKENIIYALCVKNQHGHSGLENVVQHDPERLRVEFNTVSSKDIKERVIIHLVELLCAPESGGNDKKNQAIISFLSCKRGVEHSWVLNVARYAPVRLRVVKSFVGADERSGDIWKKIINILCEVGADMSSPLITISRDAPEILKVVLGFASDAEQKIKIINHLITMLACNKDNGEVVNGIITALCKLDNDGSSILEDIVRDAPSELKTVFSILDSYSPGDEIAANTLNDELRAALCKLSAQDLRIVKRSVFKNIISNVQFALLEAQSEAKENAILYLNDKLTDPVVSFHASPRVKFIDTQLQRVIKNLISKLSSPSCVFVGTSIYYRGQNYNDSARSDRFRGLFFGMASRGDHSGSGSGNAPFSVGLGQ